MERQVVKILYCFLPIMALSCSGEEPVVDQDVSSDPTENPSNDSIAMTFTDVTALPLASFADITSKYIGF